MRAEDTEKALKFFKGLASKEGAMQNKLMMALLGLTLCCGCQTITRFVEKVSSGEVWGSSHGVLFYTNDVLVYPGQQTKLEAYLRSPRSLSGISGVTITFYRSDEAIASAVTDDNGLAFIEYTAGKAGFDELSARPVKLPADIDEDYQSALEVSSRLLVSVQPKDTRFIVVDLDKTIINDSYSNIINKSDWPMMPNSLDVLRRLSSQYSIIYLTQRPTPMTPKSKNWLRSNDFPKGALITSGIRQSMKGARQAKSPKLAELKELYPNIEIGIGEQTGDAFAYIDNGLTAYIIPHLDPDTGKYSVTAYQLKNFPRPENLQVVSSWLEAEEGILTNKRFPPADFVRRLEAKK